MDRVYLQPTFGRILFQPTTYQLNRLFIYVIQKSHMIQNKCYVIKIYVNDLFKCHVVGWKKISSNQIRGKLFPYQIPIVMKIYF